MVGDTRIGGWKLLKSPQATTMAFKSMGVISVVFLFEKLKAAVAFFVGLPPMCAHKLSL